MKTALGHLQGKTPAWTLVLDKLSLPLDAVREYKHDTLEAVRECFDQCRPTLQSAAWLDQLRSQHGDRYREVLMINTSRLAVALGRASVLENVGLAANRITGLPIIPGSAVKGLVSTWAYWRGNAINGDRDDQPAQFRDPFATARHQLLDHTRELALRILGSDDSNAADAGDIIFLGAFPFVTDKLKLEVDVLTPHTSGEPKPSFFLTVAAGATWRFPLLATTRAGGDYKELLDTTEVWLVEALTQVGIGAKTAAGYGRFRRETEADRQERLAEEQAAEQARKAEKQKQEEQAQAAAAVKADYTEKSFQNVINMARNKGQWNQLQKEIEKLKKTENAQWLAKFRAVTAGKEFKELRSKDWYPK
ncbi:MAG: type III-B CRISPR module RAMP protein Cmr6 [Verrucomicrobiae bacterium]|nr:type III-B CRISPR module RAMP protein Cmr6 [Verrucomicrobiae bacterium]